MDLGPPGIGAKDNIVEVWKKHFVLKENMLQVECTNITPYSVLEASGELFSLGVDGWVDTCSSDASRSP